jgi:alpha-1,6-mannosyltransferase
MRILDLTDAYHPESGGIRTYLDRKVRFIRESTDFEHVLVVPGARDSDEVRGRTRKVEIASPVIPGCASYRAMIRHGKLTAVLDAVRPDVIEIGNPYFQPRAARGFAGRCGLLAGFYHTDFPRAYVETAVKRVVGRKLASAAESAARRYARWVHGRLGLNLVSSPVLARSLIAGGVSNVELLPLGADVRTFHPGRRDPAWRREIGAGENDLVLVFAGRLDREKRIDVLVEMVRRLPAALGTRLVLLGQGPERRRWERAATADPRLVVLPFERDRARFARALASADVYVSAARFETFGLSVVEAQASGLPVVGVGAGAMTDRVDESCGVLVPGLDPEAMARAVAGLADEERRRALGRIARCRVETELTWERTFTRLLGLYESRVRPADRRGRAVRSA